MLPFSSFLRNFNHFTIQNLKTNLLIFQQDSFPVQHCTQKDIRTSNCTIALNILKTFKIGRAKSSHTESLD